MKKILAVVLAGVSTLAASAQLFRPEVVTGAVLGGAAGAVIGHNSGRGNSDRGALIGAATGAVLGGVVSESGYRRTQVPAPYYSPGYGDYGYRRVVYRPGYYHRGYDRVGYGYGGYRSQGYGYGSRVVPGMILGGVAGAVIGHNGGRGHAGHGAIIGAAAGGLFGAILDDHYGVYRPGPRYYRTARYYEPAVYSYPYYREQAPVVVAPGYAGEADSGPRQVTIINNYYGSTGGNASSVNSLFWPLNLFPAAIPNFAEAEGNL